MYKYNHIQKFSIHLRQLLRKCSYFSRCITPNLIETQSFRGALVAKLLRMFNSRKTGLYSIECAYLKSIQGRFEKVVWITAIEWTSLILLWLVKTITHDINKYTHKRSVNNVFFNSPYLHIYTNECVSVICAFLYHSSDCKILCDLTGKFKDKWT